MNISSITKIFTALENHIQIQAKPCISQNESPISQWVNTSFFTKIFMALEEKHTYDGAEHVMIPGAIHSLHIMSAWHHLGRQKPAEDQYFMHRIYYRELVIHGMEIERPNREQ